MLKKIVILPPIGDYPSRKEWENACWRKISESRNLLRLLVTANEQRDIVMRAAAIESLSAGKSYREIGKELWLSPQTISGINKALKENGYRSYQNRSKTERKKRKYSSSLGSARIKSRGRPRRTKYGIVHMPY